jgi:hypothetical protein
MLKHALFLYIIFLCVHESISSDLSGGFVWLDAPTNAMLAGDLSPQLFQQLRPDILHVVHSHLPSGILSRLPLLRPPTLAMLSMDATSELLIYTSTDEALYFLLRYHLLLCHLETAQLAFLSTLSFHLPEDGLYDLILDMAGLSTSHTAYLSLEEVNTLSNEDKLAYAHDRIHRLLEREPEPLIPRRFVNYLDSPVGRILVKSAHEYYQRETTFRMYHLEDLEDTIMDLLVEIREQGLLINAEMVDSLKYCLPELLDVSVEQELMSWVTLKESLPVTIAPHVVMLDHIVLALHYLPVCFYQAVLAHCPRLPEETWQERANIAEEEAQTIGRDLVLRKRDVSQMLAVGIPRNLDVGDVTELQELNVIIYNFPD